MTDITGVATYLQTMLSALADVDQSSIGHYLPMTHTRKVALLIVPFEQDGTMGYAGTGKHSYVHAHRIPCEFWIKVETGDVPGALQRGRDICLQAMRLLAADPTLGGNITQLGSSYNGTQGQIGQYNVLPRLEERGVVTFVVARLFVPVEIRETAQW